jgi:hypothetical protein
MRRLFETTTLPLVPLNSLFPAGAEEPPVEEPETTEAEPDDEQDPEAGLIVKMAAEAFRKSLVKPV